MFSAFLARMRLPAVLGGTTEDEGMDDAASMNRSLNLPWPVTESSTRRGGAGSGGSPSVMPQGGVVQAPAITISNPIPRTTPNALTGFVGSGSYNGHDGSSVYSGSANGRRNPIASSEMTVPGQWYEQEIQKPKSRRLYPPPPRATGASTQSDGQTADEGRQGDAARMAYAQSPPAVVRLDSGAFAAAADDDDEEEEDEAPPRYAYSYTANPTNDSARAVPYPYNSPDPGYAPASRSTHDLHQQAHSTHSQSEADFYSSPFDDAEASDHEDDGQAPIPVPVPARSTTSTTSSQSVPSSVASAPSGLNPAPQSMTKSRWGLKLQLQQLQLHTQKQASRSMPSLSPPAGSSRQPQLSPPLTHEYPISGGGAETDVYNHAYNYPLAKQLSPIAEQDYFSPSPRSTTRDPESRSMSLRFGGKPSPAVESVLNVFGPGRGDGDDRMSVRTRSGSTRTGSFGSVKGGNGLGGGADGASALQKILISTPLGTPGSEMPRPSPFITRHLNRTVSQTSSKSDSVAGPTPTHSQPQTPRLEGVVPAQVQSTQNRIPSSLSTSTILPRSLGRIPGGADVAQSPNSAGTAASPSPTSAVTAPTYTPTSALQTPTSSTVTPTLSIQPPPGAIVATTQPVPTEHGGDVDGGGAGLLKIPSIPTIPPLDLRFSLLGSVSSRDRTSRASTTRRVDRMPVIDASVEGHYEEEEEEEDEEEQDDEASEYDEDEDEEYTRESLHPDSFVTAGGSNHDEERGVELETMGQHGAESVRDRASARASSNSGSKRSSSQTVARGGVDNGRTPQDSVTGDSFITRRWERDAALGYGVGGPLSSSPTTTTFRTKIDKRWPFSAASSFTPAFWIFWMGFLFPVLWLVGGWHFTNAGEMPPKYTFWEWYLWNRRWRARTWLSAFGGKLSVVFGCCRRKGRSKRQERESDDSGVTFADQQAPQVRRKGKRRSTSMSKARAGKVYPALPRWVAEKQSTDDGRMRLNDPKRSLRGIQFGYPFVSRPPRSQDSYISNHMPPSSMLVRILVAPNRVLDQLYGVKLREVQGRPESGRRMFDPWIQRCRYAFCYGLILLAAGLCTASTYLIIVNTRNLHAQ